MKKLPLDKGDFVVTAWATKENGPGWHNSPVWVLVRDCSGGLRIECVQPKDQTPAMMDVFEFSEVATRRMVAALEVRR